MTPPRIPARPKVKIGISLDADLYDWIVARAGPGGEFASVSHGVERCVASYRRATDVAHARGAARAEAEEDEHAARP